MQELTEARVFRRLSEVSNMSVDQVALLMLNYFYALSILWHEDQRTAIHYSRSIMTYPTFKEFKVSQPDLYNAMVMLMQQKKYFGKQSSFSLPELRIRRILRDMSNGRVDERDFYQLLLILTRETKGVTDMHQKLRRQVHDYNRISVFDRIRNIRHLLLAMRKGVGVYPDLHAPLQKILNKLT
jgi:DNA helicase HerA-like ATPase